MTWLEVADVDAAGGDVGRHHEGQLALLHPGHHALALLLRQVTVEQLGVKAVAVEHRGHQLGIGARVAEDDRVVRVLHLQHVEEVARLRIRVRELVADVVDVIDREHVAREQQRLGVGRVASR